MSAMKGGRELRGLRCNAFAQPHLNAGHLDRLRIFRTTRDSFTLHLITLYLLYLRGLLWALDESRKIGPRSMGSISYSFPALLAEGC